MAIALCRRCCAIECCCSTILCKKTESNLRFFPWHVETETVKTTETINEPNDSAGGHLSGRADPFGFETNGPTVGACSRSSPNDHQADGRSTCAIADVRVDCRSIIDFRTTTSRSDEWLPGDRRLQLSKLHDGKTSVRWIILLSIALHSREIQLDRTVEIHYVCAVSSDIGPCS